MYVKMGTSVILWWVLTWSEGGPRRAFGWRTEPCAGDRSSGCQTWGGLRSVGGWVGGHSGVSGVATELSDSSGCKTLKHALLNKLLVYTVQAMTEIFPLPVVISLLFS